MDKSAVLEQDPLSLNGKTVLVTGATKGIGKAASILLARHGAQVIGVGRHQDLLNETREEIANLGGTMHPLAADVCSEEQVVSLFKHVEEKFGGLDVLVNVVGGGKAKPFLDLTGSDWDQMFEFNTKSCFLCSREAARLMITQGHGKIINTSSVAGQRTSILQGAHYTAAKAAVIGFTRHMARELGPHGIIVNCIAPGVTTSERIASQMRPEEEKRLAEKIPLRRVATPEDQAGTILFLASPLCSYVTGVTIDVSGGVLLG